MGVVFLNLVIDYDRCLRSKTEFRLKRLCSEELFGVVLEVVLFLIVKTLENLLKIVRHFGV